MTTDLASPTTLALSTAATAAATLTAAAWYWRRNRISRESKMRESRRRQSDYDIIIVGAGVVGSALASALARDPVSRRVLCIERSLEMPDRIIGEFLQPGGVHHTVQLGMEECLEGIDACETEGYMIYYKGEEVQLPYPKHAKFGNEFPRGRSFHYGRWVMNLRKHAMAQKNVTMVEGTVLKLLEMEDGTIEGTEYKDKASGELKRTYAPLTIVVNGCGSALSRRFTSNRTNPEHMSTFVGCHLRNATQGLPRQNHGHVFLMEEGPLLMYPVSSTTVRCLVDFPTTIPSMSNGDLQKHLREKTAPQLPESIRGSFLESIENRENLRSVPSRSLATDPIFKRGGLLLGDSLNCRHPLTGGGMTVGLGDVVMVRDILKDIKDLTDYSAMEKSLRYFYEERKRHHSSTVNILANALYTIFAPRDEPMMPVMRAAVFEYFKRGGIFVDGPVSLLGGLETNPYVLISHFFSVAVMYCAKKLFPIPYPSDIMQSFYLLRSATKLIFPLINVEGVFSPRFALKTALGVANGTKEDLVATRKHMTKETESDELTLRIE